MNMLTRTSAQEMFDRDNILMTSVDTGRITDERPTPRRCAWPRRGFMPRSTWSKVMLASLTPWCAGTQATT